MEMKFGRIDRGDVGIVVGRRISNQNNANSDIELSVTLCTVTYGEEGY
jgi:hypothetical protein